MFDLSGTVAIVTGSTRGIGKAIAFALAGQGAQVIVSSRTAQAVDAVVDEFTARGVKATGKVCDIADKAQLAALTGFALDSFGRIDTLVCNAAVNPHFGSSLKTSDEDWDRVMACNVRSSFWACNMVLPHMAERGGGRIVMIASIAAFLGQASLCAYAVSKAAEAQLVRNLAVEWGRRGICVNAVAPGVIRTDFAEALWSNDRLARTVTERTPLGRLGEPEDIGGLVAMLAAPAGRFITGQMLVADGGFSIASGL